MIILDIFKYFAQFPKREAVVKLFSNQSSRKFSLYDNLQANIFDMADHSRMPEIEGFIFGADDDIVKRQVDSLTGLSMFVDYGELDSSRDSRNSIQDSMKMAITIMDKLSTDSDPVEFMLNSDRTLSMAQQLLSRMLVDQDNCTWLKQLNKNYYLAPFSHKEWAFYGWSIVFNREAADMLNLKNL